MNRFISMLKSRLLQKNTPTFSTVRSSFFRDFIKDKSSYISSKLMVVNYFEGKVEIRMNTSDEDVFYQVFMQEEYSFALELIQKYLPQDKGLNLLDIGANIGLTSIYFANKCNINSIIAVEPDPDNFSQLEKNFINNGYKATLINKALWSSDTFLEFDKIRDRRSWAISVKEATKRTDNGTESITLKSIIEANDLERIDILKIDIEGAEKMLLDEISGFKKALLVTKMIAIELHDEFVSRIEFSDLLINEGFLLYSKGETLFGINKHLL